VSASEVKQQGGGGLVVGEYYFEEGGWVGGPEGGVGEGVEGAFSGAVSWVRGWVGRGTRRFPCCLLMKLEIRSGRRSFILLAHAGVKDVDELFADVGMDSCGCFEPNYLLSLQLSAVMRLGGLPQELFSSCSAILPAYAVVSDVGRNFSLGPSAL
jgi:hypothetical protein